MIRASQKWEAFFITNPRSLSFKLSAIKTAPNQGGLKTQMMKKIYLEKSKQNLLTMTVLIFFLTVFLPVSEIIAVTPKVRFMIDFFKNHITPQNNEH